MIQSLDIKKANLKESCGVVYIVQCCKCQMHHVLIKTFGKRTEKVIYIFFFSTQIAFANGLSTPSLLEFTMK